MTVELNPVLLVTGDPALAGAVDRLGAASGITVDHGSSLEHLLRRWPTCRLALVDSRIAAELAARRGAGVVPELGRGRGPCLVVVEFAGSAPGPVADGADVAAASGGPGRGSGVLDPWQAAQRAEAQYLALLPAAEGWLGARFRQLAVPATPPGSTAGRGSTDPAVEGLADPAGQGLADPAGQGL